MKSILPAFLLFPVLAAVACGSETTATEDPPSEPVSDGGPGPERDAGTDAATPSEAGPDAASPPPAGDSCVEGGFCWQRPTPFGTTMTGVWGSDPKDVWTVGSRGTIAHYDGVTWKLWPKVVTRAHLRAVWGSAANDVWAVGEQGTILHFDGTDWTVQASGTTANLNAISGSSRTQVDVVGDGDTRLSWNGTTWTAAPTLYPNAGKKPNVYGVSTTSTGNAWCAADPWLLQVPRRTNGAWALDDVNDPPFSSTFRAVWSASDADVWMSATPGGQGTLQHWDGTKWTNMYPPAATRMSLGPVAIAGSGPDDVWFFAEIGSGHWNGTAFDPQPSLVDEYLLAGWVHPSGEGWAVGYGGRMGHKTSLAGPWSFDAGSPHAGYDSLSDLAVIADDDVWAVGRLSLAHWDGTSWKDVAPASTTYRQEFNGVWAGAKNDVWVTSWGSDSPANLQHWNGTAWTTTAHPGPSYLNAIWGASPNDVWVSFETSAPGGSGDGMHWDGTSWKILATGPRGYAIHGSSANDVWSVGDAGKIRRYDGTSWKNVTSGTASPLYTVRAFSPTDAWAGGEGGALLRWNGASWSPGASAPPLAEPATNAVVGLAGPSSSDLWVATRAGEVFHWDGVSWTRIAWLSVGLSSIARTPAGGVLVAGGNGAVLRRP